MHVRAVCVHVLHAVLSVQVPVLPVHVRAVTAVCVHVLHAALAVHVLHAAVCSGHPCGAEGSCAACCAECPYEAACAVCWLMLVNCVALSACGLRVCPECTVFLHKCTHVHIHFKYTK